MTEPKYIIRTLDYLEALETVSGTNDQITRLKAAVRALDKIDLAVLQLRRIKIELKTDDVRLGIDYDVREETEQFDEHNWSIGYESKQLGCGTEKTVVDALIGVGDILRWNDD